MRIGIGVFFEEEDETEDNEEISDETPVEYSKAGFFVHLCRQKYAGRMETAVSWTLMFSMIQYCGGNWV